MVTAVVIPIIFFYFLYITIKERKKRIQKWNEIGNVREESIVRGKILQVYSATERYIGNYYISKTTLLIMTSNGSVKASVQSPIISESKQYEFEHNTFITCYGQWKGSSFHFQRYQIEEKN